MPFTPFHRATAPLSEDRKMEKWRREERREFLSIVVGLQIFRKALAFLALLISHTILSSPATITRHCVVFLTTFSSRKMKGNNDQEHQSDKSK